MVSANHYSPTATCKFTSSQENGRSVRNMYVPTHEASGLRRNSPRHYGQEAQSGNSGLTAELPQWAPVLHPSSLGTKQIARPHTGPCSRSDSEWLKPHLARCTGSEKSPTLSPGLPGQAYQGAVASDNRAAVGCRAQRPASRVGTPAFCPLGHSGHRPMLLHAPEQWTRRWVSVPN